MLKPTVTNVLHYHLQVQANSKKNCTKKPMLFLASMGKTGLTHDIFFEFSLGPFEVVEAEGGRLVKEADFHSTSTTSKGLSENSKNVMGQSCLSHRC